MIAMAVYLLKNKQSNMFIDHNGRELGDEDFKGPLFYFSLSNAKEGLETLGEVGKYKIEKSEIVDFVLHCPEKRIETVQHHPYVYASWLQEQVITLEERQILLSTLLCCQDDVLDYYQQLGFSLGMRNFGNDQDQLISSVKEVSRMLEGFDVIPKPLHYFEDIPLWSGTQIKSFKIEHSRSATVNPRD
jgi:hypothetical protein